MEYAAEFEMFWKAYPKRWNRSSGKYYKVGKWEAFQVWKRLSQKDRNDILIKVKYMKNGEFVLDAHRWLKKRRFDDIEIPKPKQRLVIAKEQTYQEWHEAREREKALITPEARAAKADYDKLKKELFKT